MQANKYSVYPSIGQKVNVHFRTDLNKDGSVKLVKASREERTIKRVYLNEDGIPSVQDHVGDVWKVKPGRLNTWESLPV